MAVNIPRRSVFIAIGVGIATPGLGVAAQQPPSVAALHAKAHRRNGKAVPNYTPIGPNGRVENVHAGGIEWMIKDGIPYHVPLLLAGVRAMVATARADRSRATTANL